MFTRRQSKLLEILLNHVQGVTGTKLAEYLEVSSRTVRSEIGEINRAWKDGNIIKSSRKRGYYIEETDLDAVRSYFLSEGQEKREEEVADRGWMILGMVLEAGRADIFDIGSVLALSQPAMYKEISRFQKKLLSEYQCELLRMSGDRIWIENDEAKIRQMLFRIIKNETHDRTRHYAWFLKTFLPNDFDQKEYEWIVKLVKEYFDSKCIQISDDNLYMIVSAVYITMIRNYQNHKVAASAETEPAKEEVQQFFRFLKEQGFDFDHGDRQVLEGLLHGFRMSASMSTQSEIDSLSILILEDFCHDVMEKYHFDLWQSQSFYDNILNHIEYMMRRMGTGYEAKNPILNEIKKQYPYAYEISMLMVPIVYRYKNCYIQDDEISFIAIFVEHFLENVNKKLKAVMISSARFSVNSIVSNWIQTNFQNQIELLEIMPKHSLEHYLETHAVDLVISIMDTFVHPTVATFRVDGIPNQYTLAAMNALVYKIRVKYRFREIIKEHFNQKTIRIYREKVEFVQLIEELSEALKTEDYIYDVNEFVNDVLQREVNYPTYIGDWFMIPHPLMTFAKKTAIGVGILKKPAWIHGREIQVVFLLAMEHKQNEQIGVLFEFFRHMAQDRSALGRLAAVETEEEFVEVLIHISNSLES
ncbi:MAG: PTS sugar transporter subunit IIA [Eubacterium sp.]|nr:PTS sugar transporter subunit IIA [Eubacterium sp.]